MYPQRLLITGASGFLGGNLCQVAQTLTSWEVWGTYHTHPVTVAGIQSLPLDLTDAKSIKAVFEQVQPKAVIHTAAVSQPNFCQTHPDLSYQVNAIATWEIGQLCAERGIPCVFTSTDLVFDGLHPPYRETDAVSPVNRYGEHKVLAEVGLLERHPQAVVCRMPLMFGQGTGTAKSFMQPWLNALRSGETLNLFSDEVRTPVSATTAAKGLFLALTQGQGILHLGGVERISRYDFGVLLAQVFELPCELIQPCLQAAVKMAAPRPRDVSLESSVAYRLGYQPLSLREELIQLISHSSFGSSPTWGK